MEKYQEVLDILVDENPFLDRASIYYSRGVVYSQQSDLDNAKKWFNKALEIDVKCFEVFNELVINRMVTSKNGTLFINSKLDDQLEYEDAILSK
ncbi:hypothetical protein C2G38_2084184 [Gigaspora rosea]|uniref:Uncharacterized protein n=1 Tax=Gigaspora rosea TaxID=44941 RepID=A0A397V997_9GLOM|nr:hypothetical protein C2G38_2084184 [Gigaspora rosea]